jgi:selenocysteine-specific translation elongation factor
MDLPGAKKNLNALQERFPKTKILPTMAVIGKGIDLLKQELAKRITNESRSTGI